MSYRIKRCEQHGHYIESNMFKGCPVCKGSPVHVITHEYNYSYGEYAVVYYFNKDTGEASVDNFDAFVNTEDGSLDIPDLDMSKVIVKYVITGESTPVNDMFLEYMGNYDQMDDKNTVKLFADVIFNRCEIKYD